MRVRLFLTFLGMVIISVAMMQIGMIRAPFYDNSGMIFTIIFVSLLASLFVWAVWNLELQLLLKTPKKAANTIEKQKRDRLDSVLSDLSDEELLRLRERLNDGSIDDELLYERMLGDDGELIGRR